jgi:hypothetical protein
MSISSVIGNFRGDCPVWRFEVGKFFPVGLRMEEKVPRKRFGDGHGISSSEPPETPSPKTIKITLIKFYLSIL